MIKMNVYISKKYKDLFLEKLKEIPTIDDYILDSERLGKEKIKLQTNGQINNSIAELVEILPIDSMIVNQVEFPGKEYLLCVGEVTISNFAYLQDNNLNFSIITKKDEAIRFNAWIHFSKIESIFTSNKVENFSSISGKINEQTFFIIEIEESHVNNIHKFISTISSEFIIKDNKIYVKLFMHDFTRVFHQMQGNYNKIQIIDERVN